MTDGKRTIFSFQRVDLWMTGLALAVWGCYLLGTLFPVAWWGSHFAAFLPQPLAIGLLTISGFLMCWPAGWKLDGLNRLGQVRARSWMVVAGITVLMLAVFAAFPMYQDFFGDSTRTLTGLAKEEGKMFPIRYKLVLSPNVFTVHNGEHTVLNGMEYLIKSKQWDPVMAFTRMGLVFGAGFMALMTAFVLKVTKDFKLRASLLLMVMTAPLLQNFMGRVEIYGPSIVAVPAFLICMAFTLENPSRKWWILTVISLFFSLKFHSAAFLLLPAFGLLVFWHVLRHNPEKRAAWFTWKKVGVYVLGPLLAGGGLLYFVILGDYNDPRQLNPGTESVERLFLPLVPPEVPLDRYHLLHPNHVLDFLNEILLWSASGFFMLLLSVSAFRKQLDWNRPEIILTGLTLILYTLFFFALNPLLGMPMDWDLMTLPGPVMIVLVIFLYRQLDGKQLVNSLLPRVIGLGMLSVLFFAANADKAMLSARLDSIGHHLFKTYWLNAREPATFATQLYASDPVKAGEIFEEAVKKWEPHAQSPPDREFGLLMRRVGVHFRLEVKDYAKAVHYHERAQVYEPTANSNLIGLMEAYYLYGKPRKAFEVSKELARRAFPNVEQAILYVVDIGLREGYYEEVKRYVKAYIDRFKGERMEYIYKHLMEGTRLNELIDVFTGAPYQND